MSSATAPAVLVTGLRKSFRVAGGTVGLGFLVMAAVAALAICWGTRAYQRAVA